MSEPDGGSTPQVARVFDVPLRVLMTAVLHVHPRHVKLSSANARTMRFTFDTAADGFHVGEHLTALLEQVEGGTRMTLQGGRAARRTTSETTMRAFLDDVTVQLEQESGHADVGR